MVSDGSAPAAQALPEELNEPQLRAVAHVDGPLLVFAGAGSGKTRVITYRIANLVAVHRVPPYRILAVTFTNKAAGEMKRRLDELIGPEMTRDLWVGTFHAVCARLLRRYHDAPARPAAASPPPPAQAAARPHPPPGHARRAGRPPAPPPRRTAPGPPPRSSGRPAAARPSRPRPKPTPPSVGTDPDGR